MSVHWLTRGPNFVYWLSSIGSVQVGNTRPYTEAHAVASVDVALLLTDPLSKGQMLRLKRTLDPILKPEGFSATRSRDGELVAFKIKGIGGETTEEVHIHRNFVHCRWSEYRGWTFTRDASVRRLLPIFTMAASGEIEISAVGLAYTDVFLNDDAESYIATEVFQRGGRHLPASIFDAGNMWKVKSSWFSKIPSSEMHSAYGTLAVDAKISSGDKPRSKHVTEVLHQQQIFCKGNDADPKNWNPEVVTRILDDAHCFNRTLLTELLSEELLAKIGLKDETK